MTNLENVGKITIISYDGSNIYHYTKIMDDLWYCDEFDGAISSDTILDDIKSGWSVL